VRESVFLREWSEATPDACKVLRKRALSETERRFADRLRQTTSVRVDELRDGLRIATEQHVGTVQLGTLRVAIAPKIKTHHLMAMVAYAFDLGEAHLFNPPVSVGTGDDGLVDLLCIALAREASRIAQRGLARGYVPRSEDIGTVRGRIDLRHWVRHPWRKTLRCTYDDLTSDFEANRVLTAGLRLASTVAGNMQLSADLARLARMIGEGLDTAAPATAQRVATALASLDRRTSHYRVALELVHIMVTGAMMDDHMRTGGVTVSSFLLDMNVLFERFVGKVLVASAPRGFGVRSQVSLRGAYQYLSNRAGWPDPLVRPDFMVMRAGVPIALADAKYKDRKRFPPSTADLYQLTAYGLAFELPEPRTVVILHPLGEGDHDLGTELLFAPVGGIGHVSIRLVGVPIDELAAAGEDARFWPFDQIDITTGGIAEPTAKVRGAIPSVAGVYIRRPPFSSE
jgi:5-methylcytosine-specific restriction enzyme subunit McrC